MGRPMEKGATGGKGGGGTVSGEVRFDDASNAQTAVHMLNGSVLSGSTIKVILDEQSKDGSKVFVSGLPAGLHFQALKDHFSSVGTVAFANVKTGAAGKGDWGGAGW